MLLYVRSQKLLQYLEAEQPAAAQTAQAAAKAAAPAAAERARLAQQALIFACPHLTDHADGGTKIPVDNLLILPAGRLQAHQGAWYAELFVTVVPLVT